MKVQVPVLYYEEQLLIYAEGTEDTSEPVYSRLTQQSKSYTYTFVLDEGNYTVICNDRKTVQVKAGEVLTVHFE